MRKERYLWREWLGLDCCFQDSPLHTVSVSSSRVCVHAANTHRQLVQTHLSFGGGSSDPHIYKINPNPSGIVMEFACFLGGRSCNLHESLCGCLKKYTSRGRVIWRCLHLQSSCLSKISTRCWLEYIWTHGQRQREGKKLGKGMEEGVKEVRTGVSLFKGLCIVSATPAPLVNQQIPLISHSGLEHFQSIHPFSSTQAEGCSDGQLHNLSPTWTLASSDSIMTEREGRKKWEQNSLW